VRAMLSSKTPLANVLATTRRLANTKIANPAKEMSKKMISSLLRMPVRVSSLCLSDPGLVRSLSLITTTPSPWINPKRPTLLITFSVTVVPTLARTSTSTLKAISAT